MKHQRFLTWSHQNVLRRKVRERERESVSATADRQMLPPTIIFTGKSEQTVRNLNFSPGFIVRRQEKAWMNDDLIKVWVKEIWLKHTQAKCKRLGIQSSVLSFDAFVAHSTDGVKNQLLEGNSDILAIPAGCTWTCQLMDICLNKLFKAILRKVG